MNQEHIFNVLHTLERVYTNRLLYGESLEQIAKEICQLFPKTEDNPDGYEPTILDE